MQTFKSLIKSLFFNKNSWWSVFVVALLVSIPLSIVSLAISFSEQSFMELESISYVLHIYTSNTQNAMFKLCGAISIVSIILSSILFFSYFIRITLFRKQEIKNYLYLGASYSQVALNTWLKNVCLFLVGFVIGTILSILTILLTGLIYSVELTVSVNILLVLLLLYFAFIAIISIIIPVWTNTNKSF